jgi:hypothetical protein
MQESKNRVVVKNPTGNEEKIAYFNVDGLDVVRVNVRNVSFWYEKTERGIYIGSEKKRLPSEKFVVIQLNNGYTIKVRDSIQVVDEKLS